MHWIIGDVHGMLRPLETLLEAIGRTDGRPTLLFTGDYVNRGPDSRGVIDLLLTLDNARFIRGNHDDIFDQVLHAQSYAENASRGNRLIAFQWFCQHGLIETLESYGADSSRIERVAAQPDEQALEALLECVPEEHRRFIRSLPAVIEEPAFFVAHGKWDPDEPTDRPLAEALATGPVRRQRLLWGRYEPAEIVAPKAWDRTGYFGHTPVEIYPMLLRGDSWLPIRGPKLVLLDTGAALSTAGRLTAFCHETQQFLQANHFGVLLKREPGE